MPNSFLKPKSVKGLRYLSLTRIHCSIHCADQVGRTNPIGCSAIKLSIIGIAPTAAARRLDPQAVGSGYFQGDLLRQFTTIE